MTRVAFAIAAHPDDIEFMMAGTLILLGKPRFHPVKAFEWSSGIIFQENLQTIQLGINLNYGKVLLCENLYRYIGIRPLI